jgi:hypothetical protein
LDVEIDGIRFVFAVPKSTFRNMSRKMGWVPLVFRTCAVRLTDVMDEFTALPNLFDVISPYYMTKNPL